VKGVHREGLRVLGKPERFARYYYESGADELLYMDIVASLYGRNNLLEIVQRTAKEIFIPLTVGGGLRSVDDIRTVLRSGADKVALNTAVIRRPELIQEAARRFGSSTIVVSIEAIKRPDGTYEAYTDNGREKTGINAFEWAVKAAELGAGEILVTSINQEGTGQGFDLQLTRRISDSVPIPVIACGGAGTNQHVYEAVVQGHADAVCMASILHYSVIKRIRSKDEFAQRINTDIIQKQKGFSGIQDTSLSEIKTYLLRREIACRHLDTVDSHA